MSSGNEIPNLLQFMFGEAAGLARQVASERLLCWSQALDDWLAERRRMCNDSTYRGSLTAWKRLLSWCSKTPWEITPNDIHKHIDWMLEQGYALSTITYHLNMLTSFYKWCAEQQVDPNCGKDFNPTAGVPRPKVVGYAKAMVLSRAEVRALLAILKRDKSIIGQRDYAFFLARLMLGINQKTLRQLQWGQIERDECDVWLCWGSDQERTLCPPEVWEALRATLESSGRIESIRPEDYLFAPLRDPLKREACGQAGDWNPGRCLSRMSIRNNLKLYGRAAGIPEEKLALPALRHTAVMLRQEAGDNLEQIRTFLGTNAHLKVTKKYLRQLPVLSADRLHPADKLHPTDKLHSADKLHPENKIRSLHDAQRGDTISLEYEEEQPPLPKRRPRSIPGEGHIHGFYTHMQLCEEVLAVLAEDIQGMDNEFIGLRNLARTLFAALSEAQSSDEVGLLGAAYTQAATRLSVIIKAEREQGEPSEEAQWVNEFLAMLDNSARENDAGDDNGETPSEEFWRTFEEGDPELKAASRRVTEEIAGLRLVLRRLYNLAMETQAVKALVRYVDLYGQGCTRLARLLKEEKGAQGRAAVMLREMIDEVIVEVNQEFGLDLG